jgi:hypothetical protein
MEALRDVAWEELVLLLAALEQGFLSKAARWLHTSQSTASRRLVRLEARLGGRLKTDPRRRPGNAYTMPYRPSEAALLIAVYSAVSCGPLQTAKSANRIDSSASGNDGDSASGNDGDSASPRDSGAIEDTADAYDSGDSDSDSDSDWGGGGAELNLESSDYGSGGDSSTGNTVRITLLPGIVTVYPFTTNAEPRDGSIQVVPTSSGLPVDGSSVRIWMSHQPGGPPIVADSTCSQDVGFEGYLAWNHGGIHDWACQIDRSSAYFVNLRLCIAPREDDTCSSSEARDGDEAAELYMSGFSNLRAER